MTQQSDHDYSDVPPECSNLSKFSEYSMSYISGYVIRMILRSLRCKTCEASLYSYKPDHQSLSLILRKDKGGLIYPSRDVLEICNETEKFFKSTIAANLKVLTVLNIISKLSIKIFQSVIERKRWVFNTLSDHDMDTTIMDNHRYDRIKQVSVCYLRIKFFNFVKMTNVSLQFQSKRKDLNKLTLFRHQ